MNYVQKQFNRVFHEKDLLPNTFCDYEKLTHLLTVKIILKLYEHKLNSYLNIYFSQISYQNDC